MSDIDLGWLFGKTGHHFGGGIKGQWEKLINPSTDEDRALHARISESLSKWI